MSGQPTSPFSQKHGHPQAQLDLNWNWFDPILSFIRCWLRWIRWSASRRILPAKLFGDSSFNRFEANGLSGGVWVGLAAEHKLLFHSWTDLSKALPSLFMIYNHNGSDGYCHLNWWNFISSHPHNWICVEFRSVLSKMQIIVEVSDLPERSGGNVLWRWGAP